jgi:hypothetical protein
MKKMKSSKNTISGKQFIRSDKLFCRYFDKRDAINTALKRKNVIAVLIYYIISIYLRIDFVEKNKLVGTFYAYILGNLAILLKLLPIVRIE